MPNPNPLVPDPNNPPVDVEWAPRPGTPEYNAWLRRQQILNAQKANAKKRATYTKEVKNANTEITRLQNLAKVRYRNFNDFVDKSGYFYKVGITNWQTNGTTGLIKVANNSASFAIDNIVFIWNVPAPIGGKTQMITNNPSGSTPTIQFNIVSSPIKGDNCSGYVIKSKPGFGSSLSTANRYYLDWIETTDELKVQIAKRDKYQKLLDALPSDKPPTGGGGGGGNKGKDDKGKITPPNPVGPLVYNVPSVKEAYFAPNSNDNVLFVTAGNNPKKVIKSAQELWNSQYKGAHKGMFQQYVIGTATSDLKNLKPTMYGSVKFNTGRYAFQFLYNPGTVTMDYSGAPAVDWGLELSGKDRIPLIGAAAATGTISFSILINRMPDMRYLQALETLSSADFSKASATGDWSKVNRVSAKPMSSTELLKQVYGRAVSLEDARQIRDRGTMYDVEFLMSTLIGYKLPSPLRNFDTADQGYVGAYPVELHLGKSLRYLVYVNSITLSHTIFTKDMVPVFTNVNFVCGRLPDASAISDYDKGINLK